MDKRYRKAILYTLSTFLMVAGILVSCMVYSFNEGYVAACEKAYGYKTHDYYVCKMKK